MQANVFDAALLMAGPKKSSRDLKTAYKAPQGMGKCSWDSVGCKPPDLNNMCTLSPIFVKGYTRMLVIGL